MSKIFQIVHDIARTSLRIGLSSSHRRILRIARPLYGYTSQPKPQPSALIVIKSCCTFLVTLCQEIVGYLAAGFYHLSCPDRREGRVFPSRFSARLLFSRNREVSDAAVILSVAVLASAVTIYADGFGTICELVWANAELHLDGVATAILFLSVATAVF